MNRVRVGTVLWAIAAVAGVTLALADPWRAACR